VDLPYRSMDWPIHILPSTGDHRGMARRTDEIVDVLGDGFGDRARCSALSRSRLTKTARLEITRKSVRIIRPSAAPRLHIAQSSRAVTASICS